MTTTEKVINPWQTERGFAHPDIQTIFDMFYLDELHVAADATIRTFLTRFDEVVAPEQVKLEIRAQALSLYADIQLYFAKNRPLSNFDRRTRLEAAERALEEGVKLNIADRLKAPHYALQGDLLMFRTQYLQAESRYHQAVACAEQSPRRAEYKMAVALAFAKQRLVPASRNAIAEAREFLAEIDDGRLDEFNFLVLKTRVEATEIETCSANGQRFFAFIGKLGLLVAKWMLSSHRKAGAKLFYLG